MTVMVINIMIIISIETIITMIWQHADYLLPSLPSLPCPPFPGSTRVLLAALLSLQARYGLWRRFQLPQPFSACDRCFLDRGSPR